MRQFQGTGTAHYYNQDDGVGDDDEAVHGTRGTMSWQYCWINGKLECAEVVASLRWSSGCLHTRPSFSNMTDPNRISNGNYKIQIVTL